MHQPTPASDSSIDQVLPVLLKRIEQKLAWGNPEDWSSADFTKLSKNIFAETGEQLSVTTLKRAWGRTSQTSRPSATTLNILAAYIGESHWRALLQVPTTTSRSLTEKSQSKIRPWWALLLVVVVGSIALLLFGLALSVDPSAPTAKLSPDLVTFKVDKVSQGIPNTVVFRYDLGGQQVDSLEIQQTWDESRRIKIDPAGELVTTTYLSPGYYSAKLVANGQILKSQALYLPSNGFEVYAYADGAEDFHPLPSIFWQLENDNFGYAEIYPEYQERHSISQQQLVNLLPAPIISADTFVFHTRFLLRAPIQGDFCHGLGVSLAAEEEAYFFRFGKLGCSGKFTIFLGQKEISGATTDLSPMGFKADTWVDLKITKQGSRLSLRLNDKTMLVSEEAPNFGPFGGVRLFSQDPLKLKVLSFQHSAGMIDLLQKK